MQVNEGAEEIRKGSAQKDEVEETEVDGTNTGMRFPDETLRCFDDGKRAENNDD